VVAKLPGYISYMALESCCEIRQMAAPSIVERGRGFLCLTPLVKPPPHEVQVRVCTFSLPVKQNFTPGEICAIGGSLLVVAVSFCLSVSSSVCLFPETRPAAAAGTRSGHTDCGCPRCSLPVRKTSLPVRCMLEAGTYSWRPKNAPQLSGLLLVRPMLSCGVWLSRSCIVSKRLTIRP